MTRITDTLYEDLYTFLAISCPFLLRMRNFSDPVVEKIRTHNLYSVTCFRKSCRLRENVEKKHCTVRQVIDDLRTHAHCQLDKGYKHILIICYCFSTTTMLARTRPIATLHIHFLYCYLTEISSVIYRAQSCVIFRYYIIN
jgi:hypothetical protein